MYSRRTFQSVKFCVIKCREVLSFFDSLRETCIGAEFGQLNVLWKVCDLLLVFTQQVALYSCISLSSGGIKMVSRFSGAPGFPVPFECLEISQATSPHISATAPLTLSWLTEITVRRVTSTVSSLPLKCIGQFSISFALQISSFNCI